MNWQRCVALKWVSGVSLVLLGSAGRHDQLTPDDAQLFVCCHGESTNEYFSNRRRCCYVHVSMSQVQTLEEALLQMVAGETLLGA